jgi:hypothetical protein
MPLTKATQNVVEGIVSTGSTGVSAGSFQVGQQYKITSLGTTTQSQWNTIAGTTGQTYVVGSLFTAATDGASSGTGAAAVARTLANRFADVVNVKDFGAVGDGVADDTAAIQAALNFAATLIVSDNNYPIVKSAVYFPAGRYFVASGNSIVIKKGVRIYGESRSSVFIIHGGGGVPCITSDSGDASNVQIQIEKLSITGAGISTTYGIFLKDSYRDTDIREVTVRECNVNLYLEDSFTTFIDRCDFQFSETNQIQILNATAVTIFNCRIDNAGEHGVFLDGDVKGTVHCIFDNNQIQRCQKAGIYALDIDSFYVNNGYFEGNNRSNSNWSDVHWIKGARNRGFNGTLLNCYATATTGGSNGRFATVDIPGTITFVANKNYDDLSTPTPSYEYGVFLGSSVQKMVSVNNKFQGTIEEIGRATTNTIIQDDKSLQWYLPNSNVRVTEGGTGNLNFNLIASTLKDSSLIFGDSSDAAQASINYNILAKRLTLNGYNNALRCIIKEEGQFQFSRLASPPTTDLLGGDVYFDTVLGKLRVWNGSAWDNLH